MRYRIDPSGHCIVADPVEKTPRFSHASFRPQSNLTNYVANLEETVSPDGSAAFGLTIPVPVGARIVRLQFRGGKGHNDNACSCALWRLEDGESAVLIAESVIFSTSTQNIIDFCDETVQPGYSYQLRVETAYSDSPAPYFAWGEIQYTSHNYRQTL